ncbi:MAG TPA: 6-phosphogluconolactonase [Vicinamibacterales bacterium]|nr:6-phosphogluconolactonase [Vicinamibacterales bacterium]
MLVVPAGAFARMAAECIARRLRARAARGTFSLALAGGSTPRAVYAALAAREGVAWETVHVFFGDERGVPPDHAASNYRMAHESLLAHVPVSEGHVFRMPAETEDLEAAARGYEALLPGRLDCLVLGVGADGHTASLFPGSPALRETSRAVVPATGPEARQRLTITPPVIRRARRRIVLAAGAGKAAAVRAALAGPGDPVACPARLARPALWILDEAAASGLR